MGYVHYRKRHALDPLLTETLDALKVPPSKFQKREGASMLRQALVTHISGKAEIGIRATTIS